MNSSGAGGAPAGGGSGDGGDAQRSGHKVQILVAAIAAVAALCVPVVAHLLNEDGEPPEPGADPCKVDELSQPWTQPESGPQNRQYYEGGSEPKVRVRVSGGDDPSIEVRGQIRIKAHPGQDLMLVTWPDKNSRDLDGNKGSGQYYPHPAVEPDASGCWNDPPRSVGYDGAKGITDVYHLTLVPHVEATKILAGAKGRDGYSPKDWDAFDTTEILSFTVPTA